MKAMVLRGTDLAIEDVPVPEPGPGQVLAKVLACGICGSDLHAARYLGNMVEAARASRRRSWYSDEPGAGMVMGHEYVAEVVRTGEGAGDWQPGDRVTSMPVLLDPSAPGGAYSIGYSPAVPGAYSEFVLMSAPLLLRVPDHVSNEMAATTEPCAVGLHAVREARLRDNDTTQVMGAGPIGLMTLLWLKKEGVRYVAVSDPSPERRALAGRLGADRLLDPASEDVAATLSKDLFVERPGRRDESYGGGLVTAAPDVVFECVGVPGTLHQAMQLVQVKGRVVVAGVCMQQDTITPLLGINKQLTLQFVLGYTAQEYAEALAALGDGSIDTSPLVTRTVSLEQLPAAFQALADPTDCKVIVVP